MFLKNRGFTLLEILIALFIFTIVALIMTKSLHSILMTQERTEIAAEQLREMQTALLLLSRDLDQALDRPISGPDGRIESAFLGTRQTMTLTHGGIANPNGKLQSSALQRTRYRFEKNQLIRDTWQQLDQAPRSLPQSRVLLKEIKDLNFRYLDAKNIFHAFWPPEGENTRTTVGQALDLLHQAFDLRLPRAVEINLTLQRGGTLQQIYLLPQQEVPHEPR